MLAFLQEYGEEKAKKAALELQNIQKEFTYRDR